MSTGVVPPAAAASPESYEFLLARTGEQCQPSPDSIAALQEADVVLLSGQFVAAGKSTFINHLTTRGRANVPSWTNRALRPGEQEGVDKCHKSMDELAEAAAAGDLLELEEVREGVFYATPTIQPGEPRVKDLELRGALRLRQFAPALPIVVPLPSLRPTQSGVTAWEQRFLGRDGFGNWGDADIRDLTGRLQGAAQESDRILELDLLTDPRLLLIANDDLRQALRGMYRFLATGEKPHQPGLRRHVEQLGALAREALRATGDPDLIDYSSFDRRIRASAAAGAARVQASLRAYKPPEQDATASVTTSWQDADPWTYS